ncbi:MAG: hypothetical protein IKD89_08775, partial [Clostridia bacterium]|nr:hypothetical protein [Clostridia bacterium]
YANGAVSLAWSEADGVDGYRVYRKTGTGKWTTALASTTETSWTDNTVTEGATYSYTVRSYVGKEYSTGYNDTAKTITAKAAAVPAAVDITSISYANGTVSLAWASADGVDGYRVYRKTGAGKWTTALASTTETSWTDNTVTEGKTYSYTVRSYVGKEYSTGYNDTAKTITAKAAGPAPVDITSISAYRARVVIEWESRDDVEGYRVYRKTDGGKWVSLGDLSKWTASYTDNPPELGHTYTYAVRSRIGNTYSADYVQRAKSIYLSDEAPAEATITGAELCDDGVHLSWISTDGADSYNRYKKTGDGEWTPIIYDLSGTEWIDSDVVSGAQISYAVQAIRNRIPSENYLNTAVTVDVPASFIPCSYWMVITEIKASGTNSFTIRGYDKFGYTETKTIAANARGGLFERTDAQSTDKGKESALTYANVTAAFDRAAGASGEALMFCEYSINENYKVTALRVYTGAPEMIDTSGGYESYFCEYENRDTEFFGGRFRGDLMRTRILRFDAAGKKVTALRDRLPDVGTGAMKLLSYRVIEGDFLYAAAIVTGKGSFTDYGGNEPETQAASDVIGYLRSIEKYDDHYEYVAAYGKSGGNICQSRKSGDPDEVAEKDGLLVFDDWNNTLGRNAGMAMFDMRNDGTVFNMRVLSDMTTAPAGKKSEHLSAFIVEDFVRSGNAVTGLKLRPLSGKYVNVSGKPKNGGALWTAEEKAGIFAEYDAAQSVVFDLGKNATVLIINPDTTNQAMTLPGSVTELFRASTDNSGRITGGMVVTLSYDGEAGEIVTVFANEILVK